MNELMSLLANGWIADASPHLRKYSHYGIIHVMAEGVHELSHTRWSEKARALKSRADRKEPMNFELEAEKLFMDIVYDALNQ